ncbi:hypothetical protein JOF41_006196 [Saccharothrix coeruleofusca]|uniref:DUF4267 domain-containing protein n=1 Tax=Saccharothrix coeruleofusca TaxID=33919 RepID=UPI001AEAF1EA|nr:DUF4267 domain-containing protein [Saccharothrix coeruleofusca]MBP2340018.1 hypothetical protein [Saccharothrix coeruleofusca]
MLTTTATVLAGLIGLGITVIGALGLLNPRFAGGFGIPDTPVQDPTFRSWLAVKAVRDIASGLFTFILLVAGTPQLLGWFMLAASGIPIGDALIVRRSDGPKAAAYGVHGATAAVMLVISALLLLS